MTGHELIKCIPHIVYWIIASVFSIYYAWRGILHERNYQNRDEEKNWIYIVVCDIQEVIFKLVITFSSFYALFIDYKIIDNCTNIYNISSGTAVIVISLAFWGIVGISGYVTCIISKTTSFR